MPGMMTVGCQRCPCRPKHGCHACWCCIAAYHDTSTSVPCSWSGCPSCCSWPYSLSMSTVLCARKSKHACMHCECHSCDHAGVAAHGAHFHESADCNKRSSKDARTSIAPLMTSSSLASCGVAMMPRDLVVQLFDNASSIYDMIGVMLVASGRCAKLGML